jgi:hypothetical protein
MRGRSRRFVALTLKDSTWAAIDKQRARREISLAMAIRDRLEGRDKTETIKEEENIYEGWCSVEDCQEYDENKAIDAMEGDRAWSLCDKHTEAARCACGAVLMNEEIEAAENDGKKVKRCIKCLLKAKKRE